MKRVWMYVNALKGVMSISANSRREIIRGGSRMKAPLDQTAVG